MKKLSLLEIYKAGATVKIGNSSYVVGRGGNLIRETTAKLVKE